MTDKLILDYGNEYDSSDFEEEYTQHENKLLKKVRKGHDKTINDRREILRFEEYESNDDGDYEDDLGNFIEGNDDDKDDIPDSKAWGKKRSAYYNTDFVDQDYLTYNEKEEELALQEEAEVKTLQQRLAKQLSEIDFSLDVISFNSNGKQLTENELAINDKEETKLKTDLSGLKTQDKERLFQKDSPEFKGIVEDFRMYISDVQEVLNPILKYSDKDFIDNLPILNHMKVRKNVSLTYCTNILFYLMLKAKRISIKSHPVIKRLVQLKQLLRPMDTKYNEVVRPQLMDVIYPLQSEGRLSIPTKARTEKEKIRFVEGKIHGSEVGDNYREHEEIETDDNVAMVEENGEPICGEDPEKRRSITYQIAKNKGLTASCKKELRNPRVKHRKKYRKAIIRRKGAVRTVRKELKRYRGEISGIKTTVKKSIKIKS